MGGTVVRPERRRKVSTRGLAAAAVSATAVAGGAAAGAAPADAAYFNGCAVPKVTHAGHGAFLHINNRGHAWGPCQAGGTGNGTPCITVQSYYGGIVAHNGWFYCSGGTGGYVYSDCANPCYGSDEVFPDVRLSGGHNTTHNHYLSGIQSY